MRGGGALVVVCAMVGTALLAACSESGDAGSVTSATASTSPAPSTDPPDTTAVETTAAPTTSNAPTTGAPTTTLDDEAATLAAVEQAYFDAHAAYLAAARDPSNPELRAEIARLYTGPNLARTTELLDSFVDRNLAARVDESNPSRTELLAGPQFLDDEPGFAELVACETNTERFVEIGAAPDGSDALATDEIVVERILIRFESIDGRWKSNSGEVLAELASSEQCQP